MSSLKPPDSAFRAPAIPKPIPDRGPPGRTQSSQRGSSNSLAAPQTPQALPLTSRGKVALKPGHSPLDWARLCRSEDLRGVSSFMRVTPSELAKHARRSQGVWMALGGRVYNCSRYIDFHPGGAGQLLRGAGKDATQLFMETHAWVNFEGMLEKCLVGILVPEPEPVSSDDSD